ncbi:MAG: DMT family transporter [Verrucomicrobia bacterium]|nr:DMT family transporter [Verrucomicrobiota bacterium]
MNSERKLQDRAFLGVILMIGGLALYPLSDAFVKHLMGTYSVQQVTFLRALTRFVPLCVAMFLQGGPSKILATSYPLQHLVRLGVNLAYTYSFMFAFSMASLTTIYTISYTSPFFMIILSSLILKEQAGPKQWAAVGIGMIGVLIAMRPGTDLFEWAVILVLAGTFLGALNKILMRKLAATEHSLAIAIYPNVVMMIVTAPLLYSIWKEMPWIHWGLFAFVGAITALGQYAIAQSLRYAQASTLAPIDFSTFFWVVALDLLWWQKGPDVYTLLGAATIVGCNLYILFFAKKQKTVKEA